MTKSRDLANAATALNAVTATEIGYVDGVTSAIQTQIDTKAPSSTAVTLTGTQTLTNKTLTSPVIASVVNNTLTSTTGDMIYASGANTPARLGIGSTGNVLTVAGGIPSWAAPAGGGKVLQVVYASTTTSTTITSASFTSTTLTASITPSAATSKVLILINQQAKMARSTSSAYAGFRIMRGATEIYQPNPGFFEGLQVEANGASGVAIGGFCALQYLDSPSTTSSTTYTVNARPENASSTPILTCQQNSSSSNIILLEIGA